jgi:hypothetical protein
MTGVLFYCPPVPLARSLLGANVHSDRHAADTQRRTAHCGSIRRGNSSRRSRWSSSRCLRPRKRGGIRSGYCLGRIIVRCTSRGEKCVSICKYHSRDRNARASIHECPVTRASPIFRSVDRDCGGPCALRDLAKNRSKTFGQSKTGFLGGLTYVFTGRLCRRRRDYVGMPATRVYEFWRSILGPDGWMGLFRVTFHWRRQLRCCPVAHQGLRAFAVSFRKQIECSPLANEDSFHERFLDPVFMHRFGAGV